MYFFEESNGKHIRIGEEITSSKMVEKDLNLENFVKIEGLEHAKTLSIERHMLKTIL